MSILSQKTRIPSSMELAGSQSSCDLDISLGMCSSQTTDSLHENQAASNNETLLSRPSSIRVEGAEEVNWSFDQTDANLPASQDLNSTQELLASQDSSLKSIFVPKLESIASLLVAVKEDPPTSTVADSQPKPAGDEERVIGSSESETEPQSPPRPIEQLPAGPNTVPAPAALATPKVGSFVEKKEEKEQSLMKAPHVEQSPASVLADAVSTEDEDEDAMEVEQDIMADDDDDDDIFMEFATSAICQMSRAAQNQQFHAPLQTMIQFPMPPTLPTPPSKSKKAKPKPKANKPPAKPNRTLTTPISLPNQPTTRAAAAAAARARTRERERVREMEREKAREEERERERERERLRQLAREQRERELVDEALRQRQPERKQAQRKIEPEEEYDEDEEEEDEGNVSSSSRDMPVSGRVRRTQKMRPRGTYSRAMPPYSRARFHADIKDDLNIQLARLDTGRVTLEEVVTILTEKFPVYAEYEKFSTGWLTKVRYGITLKKLTGRSYEITKGTIKRAPPSHKKDYAPLTMALRHNIVNFVKAHPGFTVSQLADQFNVNRTTLRRQLVQHHPDAMNFIASEFRKSSKSRY